MSRRRSDNGEGFDCDPLHYLAFVLAFLTLAFWQRNHSIDVISMRNLLLGVCFIVTGILDHLLLVRSLPGLRQERNA